MEDHETEAAVALHDQVAELCKPGRGWTVAQVAAELAELCRRRGDDACDEAAHREAIAWTVAAQRFDKAATAAREAEALTPRDAAGGGGDPTEGA